VMNNDSLGSGETFMKGVHTQTMKIIKPGNFMRAPSPHGLSEARRGSAGFPNMLTGTDPPRGRPVGGGGFIPNNYDEQTIHQFICLI